MDRQYCGHCGAELEWAQVLTHRAANDHDEDRFETILVCPACEEKCHDIRIENII